MLVILSSLNRRIPDEHLKVINITWWLIGRLSWLLLVMARLLVDLVDLPTTGLLLT